MTFDQVELEQQGLVGIIRLDDPQILNAMTLPMVEQIDAALTRFESTARAIVLTGAGRAFCAGANLAGNSSVEATDYGATLESHMNPLMRRLRNLPIPWITAVRGAAAGVGCSLALAADMVIASETAFFLQAFANIGLVPDGGSTYLLPRVIGRVRAMEMMLLADRLPAAKALEWGLVNRVVPDDKLEAEAMALAQRLAEGPASLGMMRRLIWDGGERSFEEALVSERHEQTRAGHTADASEGIAAFREKRKAQFTGA